MQDKTCWTTKVKLGEGHLEQLVESGRQLHDQVVFDFFAWMVLSPVRSARQYFGNDRLKKGRTNYSRRLSLNSMFPLR